MATIKKVDEKKSTYQGKEKTSYLFTLDDGLQGYASNKAPWEFKEGEQVSYTKEVKKSSRGEYNLFTFTRIQQTGNAPEGEKKDDMLVLPKTGGVMRAKSIQEMKFEGRVYCLKLAVKCLLAKAIDYPQVKEYFTEWVDLLDASIDEIKG